MIEELTSGLAMNYAPAKAVRVRRSYDCGGLPLSVSRRSEPDPANIDSVTTGYRYDAVGRKRAEITPVIPEPEIRSVAFSSAETQKHLQTLAHCGVSTLSDVSATWDVPPSTQREVDAEVVVSLARALESSGLEMREAEYKFQYFGIVVAGRRFIFVNGFHGMVLRGWPVDIWKEQPITACDVGPAAFQTDFDVEAKRLKPLRFDPGWPST